VQAGNIGYRSAQPSTANLGGLTNMRAFAGIVGGADET